MDKEKILRVIDVWLAVEKALIAGSEKGTWTHGRHCGSIAYLEQVKLLLSIQPEAESLEEKALESFQALVNSEEHKRIMDKYYGELIQVKATGHCNKCEPAPGKMVPVTPPLSDGTVRCMGCGRVMGEA